MYRALQHNGIEVWIDLTDAPKQVRCLCDEVEVVIDLETQMVLGYAGEISSGRIIGRCLQVVMQNRDLLLQKWDEYHAP